MAQNYVGHRKPLHAVTKLSNELGQRQMKHNAEKYRAVHITRSNLNSMSLLQNMKWVSTIQEDVLGETEFALQNTSSTL